MPFPSLPCFQTLTDSYSPDLIEWIGFQDNDNCCDDDICIKHNDDVLGGWGRLYFFTLVNVGSMAGLVNIPTVQRVPHHFVFILLTKHQFFFKQIKCRIFALSCPFQQALETWSRLMVIRLMFLRLWALTIYNYAQMLMMQTPKTNCSWLQRAEKLAMFFGGTQRSCLWLQNDIFASHNDTWHCGE